VQGQSVLRSAGTSNSNSTYEVGVLLLKEGKTLTYANSDPSLSTISAIRFIFKFSI
jgi:hypothetical protein